MFSAAVCVVFRSDHPRRPEVWPDLYVRVSVVYAMLCNIRYSLNHINGTISVFVVLFCGYV